MDSLPRSAACPDSTEVGAFEGMFARRGVKATSDDRPAGVFDDMFVRRGQWRKNTSVTSVQQIAENVESELAHVEYPVPSLLDTQPDIKKSTLEVTDARFVVKNTFIDTAGLDYDSLKDFLPERKIHSCPIEDILCRSSSIDNEAALPMCAGIMNTASGNMTTNSSLTRGNGIDHEAALEDIMRTASTFARGASVDNDAIIFNTASTAGGVADTRFLDGDHSHMVHACDLERMLVRSAGPGCGFEKPAFDVACGFYEVPSPNKVYGEKIDETSFMEPQSSVGQSPAAEKLRALRMMGSQIQQKIATNAAGEPETQDQSLASRRMGMVTLLIDENLQELKQMHVLPHDAPAFDASCPLPLGIEMGSAIAPVLRLADALPSPEHKIPSMLSIGSMLHHKGECRPCAFYHTRGCENKEACEFCHVCGPGEQKKRLKQHRFAKRQAKITAMLAEKANFENTDDLVPAAENGVPSADEADVDVIIE